ncbi:MAG: hypothetical protein IIA41_05650, partial [SAR324 cluster bacterium]|nr:hypothetical protein [SAR324 cluster bacterium]
RAGPFTVLAEADVVRDEPLVGTEREQLAGLAEVNWLLAEAMNLKLSYDWHDPNRDVDEDERRRTSLVFEPFVRRFTQVRVGVRINQSIPQNELENADDFFLQLHVFF